MILIHTLGNEFGSKHVYTPSAIDERDLTGKGWPRPGAAAAFKASFRPVTFAERKLQSLQCLITEYDGHKLRVNFPGTLLIKMRPRQANRRKRNLSLRPR